MPRQVPDDSSEIPIGDQDTEKWFVHCSVCPIGESLSCQECAGLSHRECTDAAGEAQMVCASCFEAAPAGTFSGAELLGE